MVDFTRYVPPGVYVEDETSSVVATVGVEPTVVAIVGEGVGHYTHTESLAFTTDTVVLSKKGVLQASITARRTTYDARGIPTTTDFVMGPSDGSAGDFYVSNYDISDGVANSVTTIQRRTAGDIDANDIVSFTYDYSDADYHALKQFNDYDSLAQAYGPAMDLTTGEITSPLTLAAKIAFENGANEIVAVAIDPGDAANGLAYALAKTSTRTDVNVIVPLVTVPDGTTAVDVSARQATLMTVQTHVNAASDSGFRRVAIVGLDKEFTPSAEDMRTLATAIEDERVVLAYPNAMNYYNGGNNTTVEVDGYYLAAAYAGRLSGLRIQDPLTRKVVRGFAGIAASVPQINRTRQSKDTMSSAGVAVTEVDRLNRLVIRHGTTTDRTALTTRELSVVRARDALFNLVQDGVDGAGLIGTPIDTQTPIRVKGVVAGLLESAVTSGIVVSYSDLKVRQQALPAGDPSVIEVRFAYQPALPLNYITVAFSLNVQTGETTLAEAV